MDKAEINDGFIVQDTNNKLTRIENMLDIRNLKDRKLNLEKNKKIESNKREITDWEFQVLNDKLPRQSLLRDNLLLQLDVNFRFNRTKVANFLKSNGLQGYSRQHIYKIIGPPVFNSTEYTIIAKALTRVDESHLLSLLIAKTAWKIAQTRQLGCAPIALKQSVTLHHRVTPVLLEGT